MNIGPLDIELPQGIFANDPRANMEALRRAMRNIKIKQDYAQYDSAYYKLPVVIKRMRRGLQGAVYYINGRGKRVYLTERQRALWRNGNLPGCIEGCNPAEL